MDAERRRSSAYIGLHYLATEERACDIEAIALLLDLEPCGFEAALVPVDPHYEADIGGQRARKRKAELAGPSRDHVIDPKDAARLGHAADLGEQRRLVLDVHTDMHDAGGTKPARRQREGRGRWRALKTTPGRRGRPARSGLSPSPTESWRCRRRRRGSRSVPRQETRAPADPAADVEDLHVRRQPEFCRERW